MASILTDQTPTGSQGADSSVSLGTVFYVDSPVEIASIRYWKNNSTWNGETVNLGLWNPSGALVASRSRIQLVDDPVGWVSVDLAAPVELALLGDTNLYTVAYKTGGLDLGNYVFTVNGLVVGIDNPPFHTPDQAGRFDYGSVLQRPLNASNTNYFIDVITVPVVGGTMNVADQARINLLNALSLTEPQNLSNTDLMRLVLADVGQTLVTKTQASAATHLIRYMMSLRTS